MPFISSLGGRCSLSFLVSALKFSRLFNNESKFSFHLLLTSDIVVQRTRIDMPVLQQTIGQPGSIASVTSSSVGAVISCAPYASPPQPQVPVHFYSDNECATPEYGIAVMSPGDCFNVPTTGVKRLSLHPTLAFCSNGLDPVLSLSANKDCDDAMPLIVMPGESGECHALSSGADVGSVKLQCGEVNKRGHQVVRNAMMARSTLPLLGTVSTSSPSPSHTTSVSGPAISAGGVPGVTGNLTSEKSYDNDDDDNDDNNNNSEDDDCCDLGCTIM